MDEKTFDVYIIKYALTSGIYKATAIYFDGEDKRCIEQIKPEPSFNGSLFSKSEYALTRQEAIDAVLKKRDKKIASLEKQIQRLKNMVIDIT